MGLTTNKISRAVSRTVAHRRLLLSLWVGYTGTSLLLMAPVVALIARNIGESAYAQQLLRQFDLAWLFELYFNENSAPLVAGAIAFFSAVALGVILSLFFEAGAFAVLNGQGGLFEGAARYWSRFVRLLMLQLLFWVPLLILNAGLLRLQSYWWSGSMEAQPVVLFMLLRRAVLLGLGGMLATWALMAKAYIVADHHRSAWRCGWRTWRLVFAHPATLFALWAFLSACQLVLFAVWQSVENLVTSRTAFAVLSLIIWQQLYVVGRLALRVWNWNLAIELDLAWRPRVVPKPEEDASRVGIRSAPEPSLFGDASAGAVEESQEEPLPGESASGRSPSEELPGNEPRGDTI